MKRKFLEEDVSFETESQVQEKVVQSTTSNNP